MKINNNFKIPLVYLITICVIVSLPISHEFKIALLTGICIFVASLILKVLLVRKILTPRGSGNISYLTLSALSLASLPILGATLWYCLAGLKMNSLALIGGLVLGLMVFVIGFQLSARNGELSKARS